MRSIEISQYAKKRSSGGLTAVLTLPLILLVGCSPSYHEPLTQSEMTDTLNAVALPDLLSVLDEQSEQDFFESYEQIELYSPRFPDVGEQCQAVSDFRKLPSLARGGRDWKRYMPEKLRDFSYSDGRNFSINTEQGVEDPSQVTFDIGLFVFDSEDEAKAFTAVVSENIDSCFDFPKTLMDMGDLDLEVLYWSATLLEQESEEQTGDFSYEFIEDTFLELSRIADILDDEIVSETMSVSVRHLGSNVAILSAASSSGAGAAFGVTSSEIADEFGLIFESLEESMSQATSEG